MTTIHLKSQIAPDDQTVYRIQLVGEDAEFWRDEKDHIWPKREWQETREEQPTESRAK